MGKKALSSVAAILGASTVVIMVLSGCMGQGIGIGPTPTSSSFNSQPQSATVTPRPSILGTTLGKSCIDFISIEELYKFNPNFALDSSKSLNLSPTTQLATDFNGISCTYRNLSSGEVLSVTIAKFDDTNFGKLKAERSTASSTKLSGSELPSGFNGFFQIDKSGGTIEIFGSGYWITAFAGWASSADDLMKILGGVLQKVSP